MSRMEFPNKTKRAAYLRSGGFCECARVPMLDRPLGCGIALRDGQIRYEHIIPDQIRPDNSLENCAALTVACWRQKTDNYDLPIIAKAKRVADRAHGIKRSTSRPMPGSKASGISKRMDGTIVRRKSR